MESEDKGRLHILPVLETNGSVLISHMRFVVCTDVESFSADDAVVAVVAGVQLHVTLQAAFQPEGFVALRTGKLFSTRRMT